jgi:hypothetical protein
MEAKRDVAAEQKAESELTFREENSLIWNLDRFRECLRDEVPTTILAETQKKTLPFDPDLITDITDDELKELARCFDLDDSRLYSHWVGVYETVNRLFIVLGEDKATRLVAEIDREIPPGSAKCAVFLALAWSRMVSELKGFLPPEARSAKEDVLEIERAVKRIRSGIDMLAKQGDPGTLKKAYEAIERDAKIKIAIRESLIDRAKEILPGDTHNSSQNDIVFQAFEFAKDVIGRQNGARGTAQAAGRLFNERGLPITPESARARKSRRNKA